MAISRRIRDTAWHQVNVREEDYYKALAELSLANKNIKNPNFFQLRIETFFLSHKFLRNSIFFTDISQQELSCLILTSWGFEVEEIAEILEIKEDSVIKIRAKISLKLNARNVPHAVYKASQAGILKIDNVDFLLHPKNKETLILQENIKTKEIENVSL